MVILVVVDLSVDPAGLRSDGRRIEAVRTGAEGDLRRAHGGTTPGGPAVWGTEVPVAAVYDVLTAVTGEVLDLLGAVLSKAGDGAQRMASAYEHADDTARARLRDLDVRGTEPRP